MRPAIYVAAVVGLAAAAPEAVRSIAASAASVAFEAMPYIALAFVLQRTLGRFGRWAALLAGCGCRGGAASIPATLAAWMLFGPAAALVRWLAALLLERRQIAEHDHEPPLLGALVALAPAAGLCGVVVTFASQLDLAHRPAFAQLAIGCVLGIFGSPCALGGVALAASLRAHAPFAAYAVLATSGIVRLHLPRAHVRADAFAYATLAVACAFVAYERGASLVHPRLTFPLAACAALSATMAWRVRSR